MNTHSSGYYSIDEEYTIIGFNDTAKEIYPNLQKGIKCYKALMGLDSPCPPCPVMNKIYGPRTYLDPIRKIYETVDAVELKLSDEKVGHAMVFSTVATAEGLKRLAPNKKPKNLIRPIQQIQRGIQTQRVALGKDSRMERAKGNQYLSNSIFNEKNVSGIHGKSVVSLMEGTQKNETNMENNIGNNKDNLQDKDFLPSNFLQNIGMRTQSRFVPAGQSTQMIIGASGESDFHLLSLTQQLYQQYDMKRVFYSAYVPLNDDPELPAIGTAPPLLREHRLYQADWLLRYYGFQADELLSSDRPNFNTFIDPKCDWALRHLEYFPVEINQASYEQLLRVPGIGNKSAGRIVRARRQATLDFEDIKKMGVVLKRAVYFITCRGKMKYHTPIEEDFITRQLIGTNQKDNWKIEHPTTYRQLSLFDDFNLT